MKILKMLEGRNLTGEHTLYFVKQCSIEKLIALKKTLFAYIDTDELSPVFNIYCLQEEIAPKYFDMFIPKYHKDVMSNTFNCKLSSSCMEIYKNDVYGYLSCIPDDFFIHSKKHIKDMDIDTLEAFESMRNQLKFLYNYVKQQIAIKQENASKQEETHSLTK